MCLAIVFKPTGLIRPFSCLLGKIFKWCIHSLRRQKKMIVFWEILLLGIHLSRIFFRKQPLVIGTSQSAFSTKHFRTLVDKQFLGTRDAHFTKKLLLVLEIEAHNSVGNDEWKCSFLFFLIYRAVHLLILKNNSISFLFMTSIFCLAQGNNF